MARTAQANIKTYAIFVKERRNNRTGYNANTESYVYVQRPYFIVEYQWNDGNPVKSYLQPAGIVGRSLGQSAGAADPDFGSAYKIQPYDDIRIYDSPPSFDSIYGQSQKTS